MKVIKFIAIVVVTGVFLLGLLVALRPQIDADFWSALAVVLISMGVVLIACVTISEIAGPLKVERKRSLEEPILDMLVYFCVEGSWWGGIGLVYAAGSYNVFLGVGVFICLVIVAALMLRYIATKERGKFSLEKIGQ